MPRVREQSQAHQIALPIPRSRENFFQNAACRFSPYEIKQMIQMSCDGKVSQDVWNLFGLAPRLSSPFAAALTAVTV
jgi:hypothetical protein